METCQQFRIAVRGFVTNPEGKVLMLKRSKPARGEMGFWELPGGGLDHGEAPQEALAREIFEETGLSAAIKEPLLVWHYLRSPDLQIIGMTFNCQYTSGEVSLSHEHDDFIWVKPEGISALKVFPELQDEIQTLLLEKRLGSL